MVGWWVSTRDEINKEGKRQTRATHHRSSHSHLVVRDPPQISRIRQGRLLHAVQGPQPLQISVVMQLLAPSAVQVPELNSQRAGIVIATALLAGGVVNAGGVQPSRPSELSISRPSSSSSSSSSSQHSWHSH